MATLQQTADDELRENFDFFLEKEPEPEKAPELDPFEAAFDLFLEGPPGFAPATSETRAQAEQARARAGVERRNVERLEAMGVDIETGGDAGLRSRLSFVGSGLPGKKRTQFLMDEFGKGNFEETKSGVIINTVDSNGDVKRLLLDERGFSLGDLADVAGPATEIGGNLATGVAAIALAPEFFAGGVFPVAVLALISALGGQTAAGTAEIMIELEQAGVTADDVQEIAGRRGIQFTQDWLLDVIGAGALKGGSKLIGFANAPLARRLAETEAKAALEAEQRLGIRGMTPGEASGQETIIAAESLMGKIPGARGPIAKAKREAEEALRGKEQKLIGETRPTREVGEEVKDVLEQRIAAAQEEVTATDFLLGLRVSENLDAFKNTLDTRALSPGEAGEFVRQGLIAKREAFDTVQKKFAAESNVLINELPEEARRFATTGNVKATATKLIEEFPKKTTRKVIDTGRVSPITGEKILLEQVTSGPNPIFLPARSKKFLQSVQDLDPNASITELRRLRQSINTAISDTQLFPGVDTGQLKLLSKSLTKAIRGGIENAPTPQIRKALTRELDHYANNIDKFQDRAVARAFRSEKDPGFTEPEGLLPNLLVDPNKTGEARRIINLLGPESSEVTGARRAAFDRLVLEDANEVLGKSVDPIALGRKLTALGKEGRTLLFGSEKAANEAIDILKLMEAQVGGLDLAAVSVGPGSMPLLDMIKAAARRELEIKQEFNNKLISGLTDSPEKLATIAPEDIARYTLQGLNARDAKKVLDMLPPDLQIGVRGKIIEFIIDKSGRAKAARVGNQRPLFEAGSIGDGVDLSKVLQNDFGATAADSIAKIESILGPEITQSLKDLAIVRGRKAQGASAAAAAGGLVGGSIMTEFLTANFKVAGKIAKFKIIATFYNTPGVAKWLKRTRNIKDPSAKRTLATVIFPKFIATVENEITSDPDVVAEIDQKFRDILGIGEE